MRLNRYFSIAVAAFLIRLCQCLAINREVWENANYVRTIDLAKSYVKEISLIEAKNMKEIPQNEYFFTLNDGFGFIPKVSNLSASIVDQELSLEAHEVETGIFKVILPVPVAPNLIIGLKVTTIYSDVLSPFPKRIAMEDMQTLILKLNKFAYSPYNTKSYSLSFTGILKGQEMELALSDEESVNVTKDAPDIKPHVDNDALIYGPVLDVLGPYTAVPMGLLYEHNKPLTKAFTLERSLWLPATSVHQVAFEEYYELTNKAAELNEGFLRIDWMKGRYETKIHWALSLLQFATSELNSFSSYYHTDLVGMVSTPKLVPGSLLLEPRFPLFGDWKYNFTLGWNENIDKFLHKVNDAEDTFIVRCPLLNSLTDVTYDNVSLNFYLPENAEFVNVSSPVAYSALEVGNEFSYLDVNKGHVKVSLKFDNLFDDMSKIDVYLIYKYSSFNFWKKVAALASRLLMIWS